MVALDHDFIGQMAGGLDIPEIDTLHDVLVTRTLILGLVGDLHTKHTGFLARHIDAPDLVHAALAGGQ